ncbi:hypothetical protein TWF730_006526 [Orbilia blumenaviensis]|uniref:Uncharacterized protein n=1 Tax=Orbilia blumenaviensis TaxID=1796055 RepID=A0AAV9VEY3_9PEZI
MFEEWRWVWLYVQEWLESDEVLTVKVTLKFNRRFFFCQAISTNDTPGEWAQHTCTLANWLLSAFEVRAEVHLN